MRTAEQILDEELGVSSIKYPDIVRQCAIEAINAARLEVIDEMVSNISKYLDGYEVNVEQEAIDNLKRQIK